MDKRAALILRVALIVAAAAALAWAEARRTPDWQIALQGYMQERLDAEQQWVVLDTATARSPEAFAPHMAQPVVLEWTWEGIEIPYPPRSVICVLFAPAGSSSEKSHARVLFVSHHSDNLWRQGWIVHEGPQSPLAPHVQETLSLLDCGLTVTGQPLTPGRRAMSVPANKAAQYSPARTSVLARKSWI